MSIRSRIVTTLVSCVATKLKCIACVSVFCFSSCGGAVGGDTSQKVAGLIFGWVFEIIVDLIPQAALCPWGRFSF